MADPRIGLHNLKPAPGSRKAPKRVGRGEGSGTGKTAAFPLPILQRLAAHPTRPAPSASKKDIGIALGLSFAASKSRTLLIDRYIVGAWIISPLKKTVLRKVEHILAP